MKTVLSTIVVSVALTALTGCGFRPLYAQGAPGAASGPSLTAIYVEPIPERVGYELRNNLLDLLDARSQPDGAAYRLKLYLTEREVPVAQQPNTVITRYNYTLSAEYELTPTGAAEAVERGEARALAAYNVASSPYATVTAQRDARDRAARDIAESIRTRLAVYFHNRTSGS